MTIAGDEADVEFSLRIFEIGEEEPLSSELRQVRIQLSWIGVRDTKVRVEL